MSHDAGNPFASPSADLQPTSEEGRSAVDSLPVFDALRGTAPWVTLLGVLGFLAAGLIGLGCGALAVMALAGRGLGAEMFLIVPVYGVGAAVSGALAWMLWSYGSRIRAFLRLRQLADLEAALASQRAIWRLLGIIALLYLLLFVLIVPTMIILGMMWG